MVRTYSVKSQGDKPLEWNFTVREFASKDGTDAVLIDDALPVLLQQIRDHFRAPVTINSGYRSPAHNARVGGVKNSLHVKGQAADIVVKGVSPLEVAQYAEHLMPDRGGIGVYTDFVHVDVRQGRGRWDNRSGREVGVAGWPGYVETDGKEEPEMQVYGTLKDVPKAYQPAIRKVMEKKALVGYDEKSYHTIEDNVINVTEDFCRVMTVLDQLGLL